MPAIENLLRERLDDVEKRIGAACARAGRARGEVTLVAVTKMVAPDVAAAAAALGLHDLGENRPQELWRKAARVVAEVRWHMIGHLQRNKIDKTLPLVHLLHSVDSPRLLSALEEEAKRQDLVIPVLLEVNTSGEDSKQGFEPTQVPELAPLVAGLKHVQMRGLMTMAALQEPEACRPSFVTLRQLRDRLRQSDRRVEYLSMGMSNDFEVAIEEGATHVRLGSVLFEGMT
jgi:pyridoxal phosphate enzyme (YggS family)